MFNDAYSVLVKLTLQNQVSAGLMSMSRQFIELQSQAISLQMRLRQIRLQALTGIGLIAAGGLGFGLISKALKPAEEYVHQLNIMHMAGMKNVEVAQAIQSAWKNTSDVITTSATDNLKSLLDMRNILGDINEAQMALPYVSKMQAVLMSSKEGQKTAQSPDFAFNVAKSLDIIGAVKNKQEFQTEAELMSKAITATQGRVSPVMFQQTFAYARQAKYALDNAFKYEILPSLMMEYSRGANSGGGGSRGVGPMLAAAYRFTNQGYVNKKSLDLLKQLGLVNPATALTTTTSGTTVGPLKGAELAGADPFLWVQQVVMPAIYKKFGNNLTKAQVQGYINQLTRGNQLAGSLFNEFATKPYAFYRDQNIIRKAMPVDQAYQRALVNDPQLAKTALSKQWENFQIAFTKPLVLVLIPVLEQLSTLFNTLANVMIKYPSLTKILIYSFTILSGSLLFGGSVLLLSAAFKGLMVTITIMKSALLALNAPTILVVGALALVGYALYELYKHWDTVKLKVHQLYEAFKDTSVYKIAIDVIHAVGKAFGILIDKLKHAFSVIVDSNLYKSVSHNVSKGVDYLMHPLDTARNVYNTIVAPSHHAKTYKPENKQPQNQPIHVHVNVDGRKVASVVANHIYNAATKVPNLSSQFDTGLSPMPSVANAIGISR